MTYVNPQSVLAVGILFIILGTSAVGLRLWLRTHQPLGLGIDDWLCLPAIVFLWAEAGLQIAGARTHTFGWHAPSYADTKDFLTDESPSIVLLNKLEVAYNLIHPTAMGLLKLSVCFLYRRIFRGHKFKVVIRTSIGAVILWIVTFTVAYAAACGSHWKARWSSVLVNKQQCKINTSELLLAYSITDVVVDLLILVIPIPLVFGLHMPLKRKFEVCGVLLVGSLAIACGMVRMVYNIKVITAPFPFEGPAAGVSATDLTGAVSLLLFWATLELGVAMIAICLPTLRPLVAANSIGGVIRSARSFMSLRSTSSGNGQRSEKGQSSRKADRQGSEEDIIRDHIQSFEPERDGGIYMTRVYNVEIA